MVLDNNYTSIDNQFPGPTEKLTQLFGDSSKLQDVVVAAATFNNEKNIKTKNFIILILI